MYYKVTVRRGGRVILLLLRVILLQYHAISAIHSPKSKAMARSTADLGFGFVCSEFGFGFFGFFVKDFSSTTVVSAASFFDRRRFFPPLPGCFVFTASPWSLVTTGAARPFASDAKSNEGVASELFLSLFFSTGAGLFVSLFLATAGACGFAAIPNPETNVAL